MIVIHSTNKKPDANFTVEQLRSISHLMDWSKLYKYIDPDSITMEFMETFKDEINKRGHLFQKFTIKSTHLDVVKLFSTFNGRFSYYLTYSKESYISEEFISYYKDRITDWDFIMNKNLNSNNGISEKLFEEIYPYIMKNEKEQTYIKYGNNTYTRNIQLFNLMMENKNLSEECIKKYKSTEIEDTYKMYLNLNKFDKYNKPITPTFNFLKVYRDIIDWELVMKYAPIKTFTKNFVVEFYSYIAPLCISIPDVDPRIVKLVTKYRKYIKKN